MAKECGIIFCGESVRGTLAGRKTMTRRVIKPQPKFFPSKEGVPDTWVWERERPVYYFTAYSEAELEATFIDNQLCPYGVVGDRLWVRETFLQEGSSMQMPSGEWKDIWHSKVEYVADGAKARTLDPELFYSHQMVKRPSIFMPKWAARIWLEIMNIRAERVQDISEKDLRAEGMQFGRAATNQGFIQFKNHWDSLNAKRSYSWESNPWVWVIEFKRIEEGG